MRCDEAAELITGLIDDELTAAEQSAIEIHLEACADCKHQFEVETTIKAQMKLVANKVAVPAALRQAIERQLNARPARIPAKEEPSFVSRWFSMPFVRPVFAAALLLLLFLPLFYTLKPAANVAVASLPIHSEINRDDHYKRMAPVTDMAALKARLVAAAGGKFGPMGYDLSMIQVYPVTGFVRQIRGRTAIVTVYQGTGQAVTCITLLGSEADAPSNAQVFYDSAKQMNFYSFTNNGVNGVLHQEGDVICIMLSEMPPGNLLALVREKAHSA